MRATSWDQGEMCGDPARERLKGCRFESGCWLHLGESDANRKSIKHDEDHR